LRIEPTNHIYFRCQFYDNRQICIQDQYEDEENDYETNFDDIYKIKIHEPTLRELMTLQSIYSCKTISDVTELVKLQPTPMIFFKVFLELGMKPMLSYLAFDRNSIGHLLQKEF